MLKQRGIQPGDRVALPTSELANLVDIALELGQCRAAPVEALEALGDSGDVVIVQRGQRLGQDVRRLMWVELLGQLLSS